jgi:hypothetical protein
MKPVVTYKEALSQLAVGDVAFITALEGHPRQGTADLEGSFARTSMIVRVGENGEFETENTIYKRRGA